MIDYEKTEHHTLRSKPGGESDQDSNKNRHAFLELEEADILL